MANQIISSTPRDGEAVGVEKVERKWYLAIVGQNAEKACRERLMELGYETYVATQMETRQWKDGRRREVERVVIHRVVFVHVTESERRAVISEPYISKFMTDQARVTNNFGVHPLATVSDSEMHSLRFMLFQADQPVEFRDRPVRRGTAVKVLRGSLAGLSGIVTQDRDRESYVTVNIGILGAAWVRISMADVELLNEKTL